MSNLTLLIPAHKESESLPIFLKELENYSFHKMIVLQEEDTETIESISKIKNIEILTQKKKGYGSALKEGIEKINTEFFCVINADGSMDPIYLEDMLKLCQTNDFVFASRYLKEGGSDDDNIVSFLGNFLFKLNLSDILYTYLIGRTSTAKKLGLDYFDFRICVEIPIMLKIKKFQFISTASKERKRIAGKKKVNAIKDGFLILTAIISLFLRNYFRK